MTPYEFELLDAGTEPVQDENRRRQLLSRPGIQQPLTLKGTSRKYVPDDDLRTAMNTAIALGMPLLLTGESGTGKTQCAYHAADRLGVGLKHFQAQSTSTATDLLYHFDTVRYFHDSHSPGTAAGTPGSPEAIAAKMEYVTPRELWDAFKEGEETGLPCALVIDEIDKAPRDFPNDLLHQISEMSFKIREVPGSEPIECPPKLRPLIFITSNDERRLPNAFLRRCISHHIELTFELLMRVATSHKDEYPALDEIFITKAVERVDEIRTRKLEKAPASGELLNWLQVLSIAVGCDHSVLERSLDQLPYLSTLLKSPDSKSDLS